ncbi:rhodanese-like domain-containing protein [Thalassotalea sp. LPB0316]|uniref:rhodanese-like domain-containing protein n=1 Tax=Thalassotalea sp. LPB0316 TaxID=2769490 RepID=UPI001865B1C8|nr:rhodanese-like domain-containing protein [Thalassotalea sp. LPB0316]QOL26060.1 rhodanese-like domain-containing protein [Thalassotalea sp. LPB0316]
MTAFTKVLLITATLLFSHLAQASETPQISQTQLLSMQNAAKAEKFVVLDVRSQEEYNQGHIEGAINFSHDQIADQLAALQAKLNGDKDTLIIVHCRSGRRAAMAEEILKANDFTQVRHLTGDIKLWQENNLPLTTNR